MSKEITDYIHRLLGNNKVDVPKNRAHLFQQFAALERQQESYQQIASIQQAMVERWKETRGIADIKDKPLQLPNARVGKPYSFTFDLEALGMEEVAAFEIARYETTGLAYDAGAHTLTGTPTTAGDYKLLFRFRHTLSAEDAEMQEKELPLIVNADPKSLWKDEASDRDDPYWKEDAASTVQPMGDKTVVIASKRGRSHAHEGKFRDDEFKAVPLADGWNIIAVADGAGSAKFSRRGSVIACESVTDFFANTMAKEVWEELEKSILANAAESNSDTQKALSKIVLEQMGKAAYGAHNAIAAEATKSEAVLKDYGTTLLFALFKKFEHGYFITSFWVGDGGIGIYRKEAGEVMVLGTPDGGEFAGQTRFLTMPDIFTAENFYSRISLKTVPDFTALILMTDGITDPKFSTDANLNRIEKWNELWDDLNGKNEDGAAIRFDASNENIEAEALAWLDFWSPGNHDDRTIAILF